MGKAYTCTYTLYPNLYTIYTYIYTFAPIHTAYSLFYIPVTREHNGHTMLADSRSKLYCIVLTSAISHMHRPLLTWLG